MPMDPYSIHKRMDWHASAICALGLLYAVLFYGVGYLEKRINKLESRVMANEIETSFPENML